MTSETPYIQDFQAFGKSYSPTDVDAPTTYTDANGKVYNVLHTATNVTSNAADFSSDFSKDFG